MVRFHPILEAAHFMGLMQLYHETLAVSALADGLKAKVTFPSATTKSTFNQHGGFWIILGFTFGTPRDGAGTAIRDSNAKCVQTAQQWVAHEDPALESVYLFEHRYISSGKDEYSFTIQNDLGSGTTLTWDITVWALVGTKENYGKVRGMMGEYLKQYGWDGSV